MNLATGERRSVEAGGLVVKIGKAPRTELLRDQLEVDPLRRGQWSTRRFRPPHALGYSPPAMSSSAPTGASPPPWDRDHWRRDPFFAFWLPHVSDRRSLARASGERSGVLLPPFARSQSTAG